MAYMFHWGRFTGALRSKCLEVSKYYGSFMEVRHASVHYIVGTQERGGVFVKRGYAGGSKFTLGEWVG